MDKIFTEMIMRGVDAMRNRKQYLSPIASTSMMQQVIDRITNAIIAGELKPGDKLPTEQELVDSFGVARNTVREAIRVLVAYGVLEVRRPEGTFVCTGFSTNMINPMLYRIILQKDSASEELLGFRKVIETGVMQLVMENGLTEEESTRISAKCDHLVHLLQTDPSDTDAIHAADIAFHDEICKTTKNRLVEVVHDVIVQLSSESRRTTIRRVCELGDAQYLIDTHINLLAALKSGDSAQLGEAIRDSYFYWKDIYRQKDSEE